MADIEVNMKTGKIVAKHLYVAHANGITASPDLVANQAEGARSWASPGLLLRGG